MTRNFNVRRSLLLGAALLIMTALALTASPVAASDDDSRDEALRAVQDYFEGKSSRAEALAAVGAAPSKEASAGSGILPPAPSSSTTTAKSTNNQETSTPTVPTASELGVGCANGETPVVLSGSLPDHEDSLDISLSGDPDAETMTMSFNDFPDHDPIVIDVSNCL